MNSVRSALFGTQPTPTTKVAPVESASTAEGGAASPESRKSTNTANMTTEVQGVVVTGPNQTVIEGVKGGEIVACPDPSAHEKHYDQARLQEQASKAALYVTHPEKNAEPAKTKTDAKLSSASASASLKHARAQDLPGYPSTGGLTVDHSHSAANLANTNHKTFEHWKPDASHSAGKAALLAHDNQKPFEHWRPEMSSAGSRAAVLAHRGGPKNDWWQPEASKEGNSAAHMAMVKKGLAPSVDYGYTEDGRKRALMAATGAVRTSNARKRADSAPAPAREVVNPLRGTTVGMRSPEKVDANRWSSDAMQAARIQHSHASREMYTEHPPVEIERVEAQHQAALRASAVSMAKKMYDVQQHNAHATAGAVGASAAHARSSTSSLRQESVREAALQHLTLQEAAQRLAQQKLANMKTDDAAAFREYYNTDSTPRSPKNLRSRLSLRGHRRASSDATSESVTRDRWADSDDEDEQQSRRIRKQMNNFKSQLQDVDVKKQQSDRAALIAAAEKKVQAQMLKIDDKVFNDTGKMSPAMVEEYENKARQRLQQQREAEARERGESVDMSTGEPTRSASNEKVHIGGNKYMSMAEVEAIARTRVNPTLAEIDVQAEKQRAKDAAAQFDKQEKKRSGKVEKEKEQERKMDEKRARAEEKAQLKEEKQAEKMKLKEEKRMAKEEKRRSKHISQPTAADEHAPVEESGEPSAAPVGAALGTTAALAGATAVGTTVAGTIAAGETSATADAAEDSDGLFAAPPGEHTNPSADGEAEPETPATIQEPPWHGLNTVAPVATTGTMATLPTADGDVTLHDAGVVQKEDVDGKATATSPNSDTRSEKGGIRGLLNKFKRRSKMNPGELKGFAGGHRLHKSKGDKEEESATGAKAGPGAAGVPDEAERRRSSSVSSLSSSDNDERTPTAAALDEEDDEPRGRQRLSTKPPTQVATEGGRLSTTNTNASGGEEFEEARDQFDDGLTPPQPVFTSQKSASTDEASPHRDSKFIEDV